MGTAVKSMGGGRGRNKKRFDNSRTHIPKSPLDRAAGWELIWNQVAPVFEVARRFGNPSFVYFIGEDEAGPIKIGSAKDPVLRLRGLQTGNSRRLRIEHVLIGDGSLERLLHELWEPFTIRSHRGKKVDALPGTEWFTAEIRTTLEPIMRTAAAAQAEFVASVVGDIELDDMTRIVREAHAAHDFAFKRRDEVLLLGATVGTVVRRRSRV